jgi:hypothetical protein
VEEKKGRTGDEGEEEKREERWEQGGLLIPVSLHSSFPRRPIPFSQLFPYLGVSGCRSGVGVGVGGCGVGCECVTCVRVRVCVCAASVSVCMRIQFVYVQVCVPMYVPPFDSGSIDFSVPRPW